MKRKLMTPESPKRKEPEHNQDSEVTLNADFLKKMGFYDSGKVDITGHIKWRLKIPFQPHKEIQITLGAYPKTNPNCGIVSIVHVEINDFVWSQIDGEQKGFHKIERKPIHVPEKEYSVASHIHTPHLLVTLINILTYRPI